MTEGFTDITPPISSILTYTPAMKIGSSIIVGGIGGNFIPGGGGGSSSSMKFYKCASIDTTNHRWTGYLASVDPVTSVWSFAETATSGLAYDRITPVVGSVYDANCNFKVTSYNGSMPSENLVFYLPLDSARSTAITGQPLTMSGTVVFTEVQGIPCAYFDGSSGYTTPAIDLSQFPTGFTLSVWGKNTATEAHGTIFGRRSDTFYSQALFCITQNRVYIWAAKDNWESMNIPVQYQNSNIINVVWTFSNGVCSIYINGTLAVTGSGSLGEQQSGDTKIGITHFSSENFIGYLSSLRLYSRVLDSTEIATLASEFTPTA